MRHDESGVIEAVDWNNESAEELYYARYRAQRDVEARKRLGGACGW